MQLTGSLKLGIAGLAISVRYRFPEFREFCSKYLLPDNSSAVFEVCATDEQIAEEMKEGTQNEREAEFLCIYRAIAENLPFYNMVYFSLFALDRLPAIWEMRPKSTDSTIMMVLNALISGFTPFFTRE